jgi:hypothetical protein
VLVAAQPSLSHVVKMPSFSSRVSRLSIFPRRKEVTSGLSFSDGSLLKNAGRFAKLPDDDEKAPRLPPAHLQRNKSEKRRLQGLYQDNSTSVVQDGEAEKPRVGWRAWFANESKCPYFFFSGLGYWTYERAVVMEPL